MPSYYRGKVYTHLQSFGFLFTIVWGKNSFVVSSLVETFHSCCHCSSPFSCITFITALFGIVVMSNVSVITPQFEAQLRCVVHCTYLHVWGILVLGVHNFFL